MENRIGLILKNRRNDLHMTQMQVADESDIPFQSYQRYENGSRDFSKCNLDTGLRVCLTLELNPFEVVFEDAHDVVFPKRKQPR